MCNLFEALIISSKFNSMILILSDWKLLNKSSKLFFVSSSVSSQFGVLTNPILMVFRPIFLSIIFFSSSKTYLNNEISSTYLDMIPKVSIEGELGSIPDLSKSPYVGL